MPTLPLLSTTKYVDVELPMAKVVEAAPAWMESVAHGVVVPIPSRLLVLSHVSCDAPAKALPSLNCICPAAPPGVPPPPQVPLTAKHPAVRLMPLAAVEVAVAEVRLKLVALMPALKVEVALPCTARLPVVVAPPEMVSPPACVPSPMVEEPVRSALVL